MRGVTQGILFSLVAAILFGLVNVSARESELPPLALGGYAYLLAGLLLAVTLRRMRIDRRDWPKIATMSLVGGALAPALLFFGLRQAAASDASILLTLEMVFTALLAAAFLRERARPLAWLGIVVLFASAVLIAVSTTGANGATTILGAILVALAAFGWGVDNTVSARLVGAYEPHQLVSVKGLVGGATSLLVALLLGQDLSIPANEIDHVAYIGALGIGGSIVLFYHSLRRIGATLTSSLFLPTAALAGVLGGGLLLDERLTFTHAAAGALAVAGILLVSRAPPAPIIERPEKKPHS